MFCVQHLYISMENHVLYKFDSFDYRLTTHIHNMKLLMVSCLCQWNIMYDENIVKMSFAYLAINA